MSYPVPVTGLVYFFLAKKIRLDFSCESSAEQRVHLKHQILFSPINNEKIFMNVICCSHDWHFKGYNNVIIVACVFSFTECLLCMVRGQTLYQTELF